MTLKCINITKFEVLLSIVSRTRYVSCEHEDAVKDVENRHPANLLIL
jgi:hypothetical protein